ncbi:MAG: TonB-dependent receptor [Verrucomicrobiae bacterium]|nr:TonB-dependent receptor [Verrucomicrobiae bacterium]
MKRSFATALAVCSAWGAHLAWAGAANTNSIHEAWGGSSVTNSNHDLAMSEIVVSATKFGEEFWKSGSSISVVPESDIQLRRATTTGTLALGQPGVTVFSTTGIPGGGETIALRGFRPSETLITVDGLRYNRPVDGEANLNTLPPLLLGNMEFLRGPQSSLYGSDSIGGVVSLSTPAGRGKPVFGTSFEGGTYDYRRERVFSQGKVKAFDWNVGYSRLDTDNDRPNSAFRQDAAAMRLGYDIYEPVRADLIARFTDETAGAPSSIGAFGNDPSSRLMQRMAMVSPQLTVTPFEAYESKLVLGYIGVGQKFDTPSYPTLGWSNRGCPSSVDHTESYQLNWQNTVKLADWNTLVAGLEARRERVTTAEDNGNNVFERAAQGYFLSDSIRLEDQWGLTLSSRFDDNERYADVWTYRASQFVKIPVTESRLHASFGTGSRVPTMQELCPMYSLLDYSVWPPQPYFTNNANLTPERSEGCDAGVTQPFLDGELEFDSTYFYNTIVNIIMSDARWVSQNFPEARTEGVENSLKWNASRTLSLRAAFTLMSTTIKDPLYAGRDFARTPTESASLQINWSPIEKWNALLSYSAVGPRFDTVTNQQELSSYHRVDLATGYEICRFCSIFGRIENLVGYRYQTAAGYPALGRTFYGGLELKY